MWVVRDGDDLHVRIDEKYAGGYPTIVPSIVAPQARVATLELTPHREETT